MTDIVTPSHRSKMMSAIKGKNTKPELIIRSGLHARGFRYKLHDSRIPGKPDMVFPKYRAVIFVNGCFWHMHECHLFKLPSTRQVFWQKKLERNRERDQEKYNECIERGWRVLIVWECGLRGKQRLSVQTILDTCESWLRGENRFMSLEGLLGPASF